jgi:hypothetical protein
MWPIQPKLAPETIVACMSVPRFWRASDLRSLSVSATMLRFLVQFVLISASSYRFISCRALPQSLLSPGIISNLWNDSPVGKDTQHPPSCDPSVSGAIGLFRCVCSSNSHTRNICAPVDKNSCCQFIGSQSKHVGVHAGFHSNGKFSPGVRRRDVNAQVRALFVVTSVDKRLATTPISQIRLPSSLYLLAFLGTGAGIRSTLDHTC